MKNMQPEVKRTILIVGTILILAVLAIVPRYISPYYLAFLMSMLMFLALTVAWATFCGPSGYISLGSAAFFGIGIYTTALLGEEFPIYIAIIISCVACFLFALLVGATSLRIKGIFFVMFTFGLSEMLRNLAIWLQIVMVQRQGFIVVSIDTMTAFYVMLIIFILALIFSYFIRRTKYGLALQAIGEQEEAADHIGVNVNMVKIIIFAITSVFMAAAGAVMATQWSYIEANIAFNAYYSFAPALMAIFGGIGSILGWLIGAVAFTVLAEVLLTNFPYLYMLLFGITIICVMIFLPSGLISVQEILREKMKRA